MSHNIDNSTGEYAFAFRGAPGWHGLGFPIMDGDTLDEIQVKARLNFGIEQRPLVYGALNKETGKIEPRTVEKLFAHVRNDTQACIGTGSDRFNIVQPRDVLEFYRDLVTGTRYSLETAGALDGGAKIFALAKANIDIRLGVRDAIKVYLLFSTANDGSMSTRILQTGTRVVCANTMAIALSDKSGVSVPHSRKVDAQAVKSELGLLDNEIVKFAETADTLTQAKWTDRDTLSFFVDLYGKKDEAGKLENEKHTKRVVTELMQTYKNGPGADMETANGTAWGAVQAVTHFVDHKTRAHSANNRFTSAQFGIGADLKRLAMSRALELVAA